VAATRRWLAPGPALAHGGSLGLALGATTLVLSLVPPGPDLDRHELLVLVDRRQPVALAQVVGQGPVRDALAGHGLLLDLLERRLPLIPAARRDDPPRLRDPGDAANEGHRPGRLTAVHALPLATHPRAIDPLQILLAVDSTIDLAAPVVPNIGVAILLPDVLLEVPVDAVLIADVDLHEIVGPGRVGREHLPALGQARALEVLVALDLLQEARMKALGDALARQIPDQQHRAVVEHEHADQQDRPQRIGPAA